MAETITKAELINNIKSIIEDMSIVLDDETLQDDSHGIVFACLGYETRARLMAVLASLRAE